MLSLLFVIFCAFITIDGLETCKEKEDEDTSCTTPCGVQCSTYHRNIDREPSPGSSCAAAETAQDCQSIAKAQYQPCEKLDYWVDLLWGKATREEKASGKVLEGIFRRSGRMASFRSHWRNMCQVQKAYRLSDVTRMMESYRQGAVNTLTGDDHKCSEYQSRDAIDIKSGDAYGKDLGRNYLFVMGPKAKGMVIKYCGPAPGSSREPAVRTAYEAQILNGFKEKAARARAPPKSGIRRAKPLPPPKPREGRTHVRSKRISAMEDVSHITSPVRESPVREAHEEYVDDLWSKVNQMEEDDLRYERALDKLRRATQLREMHKKRLRRYYN